MGHDIYGMKIEKMAEVAYLRRGALNVHKNEIYEALECMQFNGGCSGFNEGSVFSLETLKKGMKRLKAKKNPDLSPEIEFLEKCIKNVNEDGEIYIQFN